MDREFGYTAFISYSHRDERVARWLHRALETYRIPRRLVGAATPRGPVQARLGRFFRDRDELSAGESLSDAVQSALENSRSLIVLCSPDAVQSRWVNEEISTFRTLRPDGDILVAIVSGEPDAAARSLDPALECYPAALFPDGDRTQQPAGADFRREGDGRSVGRLKLIAGLLGLPLDQIIQRDLQRRNRRVTAVTVVACLTALVLGGLTVFAMSARTDAERRRAEAEDLIEFMLNDLRDRLEPVGRLDVLDAVGAKVIEYYETQPARSLMADSLGRQSRAYHLLGEIDGAQGNLDGAIVHFRNAYLTTQQILAVDPDAPARIYEHSQSAYWVGYFAYLRGDLAVAEQRFNEYRDLAVQLAAIDPENLEWRHELAYAHSNLGTLYIGQYRYDEAREAFRDSLNGFIWLSDAQPDSSVLRRELADAWGWMARVLEHTDGPDAALDALRQQIEAYGQIDEMETNWIARRDAVVAELGLARLLLAARDTADATAVEEAIAVLQIASLEVDALIDHEPSNAQWLLIAVRQRLWLARTHLYANNVRNARSAYLDAWSMMAHPTWQEAEGVEFTSSAVQAAQIEASILIAAGEYSDAEQALLPVINRLASTQDWHGVFDDGALYYAAVANLLAEIYLARQNPEAAREVLVTMTTHLSDVEASLSADAAREFDRALRRLETEFLDAN